METYELKHTAIAATILFSLAFYTLTAPSHAAVILAEVRDDSGAPIMDAVIYADPLDGKTVSLHKPKMDMVDQVDKEFVSQVNIVRKNTPVKFPNKDKIHHHVYSFSKAKTFELPLYMGTPANPVIFDKTGEVALGCNIHDWMVGYIFVLDTPYFGKTNKDGATRIEIKAKGEYSLNVWHSRLKGAPELFTKKITVNDNAEIKIEFRIELKPDWTPRRAPILDEEGYR